MPLHATSSGVCHFKWRMPLQVAHATSSGVSHREHATSCHFMPLHAASSGACHVKWRVAPWACHFMPLQVAAAPWACHFMPLQVAVAPWACHFMPLHATSSGVKWREVAKSVYAPPACSMKNNLDEGWCGTLHYITIHQKRIDLDEGWCATLH